MVKSSSRPRKASKFTIDLGPEIDKVVKKKLHTRDVKIKKQKVIILGLKKERDELRTRSSEVNDLKMKKFYKTLCKHKNNDKIRTVNILK